MIMNGIKKIMKDIIHWTGFDIVRFRTDYIYIPRFLCPSGYKLFDFRKERDFSEISKEIKKEGRTSLDFNRLFVLWQAVKNTHKLNYSVAEVGSYKGGSAKFIAASFSKNKSFPQIHIFDTFSGHPAIIDSYRDGAHYEQRFSDTSFESVSEYLPSFNNIRIHRGVFEDTCVEVEGFTFSLVHIDVDIYKSTLDCLKFFWPRLCEDGVILIDDYGFVTCSGLKEAVDGFIEKLLNYQCWYIHTGQFVIQKLKT